MYTDHMQPILLTDLKDTALIAVALDHLMIDRDLFPDTNTCRFRKVDHPDRYACEDSKVQAMIKEVLAALNTNIGDVCRLSHAFYRVSGKLCDSSPGKVD